VNYAEYTAPLLVLLRKGSKWKWDAEMQHAFEKLRNKFAQTIHLVQPNDDLPYIINTDASCKAIGAVLLQQDEDNNVKIVSTASRVLSQVE
jgi:hypothetical protein